jgi:hypothetical protein
MLPDQFRLVFWVFHRVTHDVRDDEFQTAWQADEELRAGKRARKDRREKSQEE